MKTTFRAVSACALAAGLFIIGVGNVQATVIENEVVTGFNAKLVIAYSDNGKVKKVRITSKDMVNAISSDFGISFKGDQIVYWDGDYWLMDKHNNLVENLTSDDVLYYDEYSDQSYSEKSGKNGSYREAETGYIYELEFDSDGSWDGSTLAFYSDYTGYTYSENWSPIFKGKQFETIKETDGFGGYGHDWNVSSDEYISVWGTILQNGSGIVTAL
ncbi:MAG TPA: hypothetical protein VFV23_05950 [Verrucomicrobiae bacterium]|nr:hypothetical protein [Verrucomicrobiae bacterium]